MRKQLLEVDQPHVRGRSRDERRDRDIRIVEFALERGELCGISLELRAHRRRGGPQPGDGPGTEQVQLRASPGVVGRQARKILDGRFLAAPVMPVPAGELELGDAHVGLHIEEPDGGVTRGKGRSAEGFSRLEEVLEGQRDRRRVDDVVDLAERVACSDGRLQQFACHAVASDHAGNVAYSAAGERDLQLRDGAAQRRLIEERDYVAETRVQVFGGAHPARIRRWLRASARRAQSVRAMSFTHGPRSCRRPSPGASRLTGQFDIARIPVPVTLTRGAATTKRVPTRGHRTGAVTHGGAMLRFLTRLGVTSLCEHPDDVSERVQIDLTEAIAADKARERPVHPWFAVRAPTFARAAVVLTLLRGSQSFASVGESTTVEQLRALAGLPTDARPRILDLFAGTGAVAGAAGGWGCEADAVELNPVAHLITVASWTLAPALSDARGDWRGLADEVADHHEQIWTSARDRLRDVFKDGSYAYVWQLTLACPSCSCAVPFGDPTRAAPFLREDVTERPSRTRVQCPECGAAVDRRAPASTGQGWRLVTALADARAGIANVTAASQAAELVASQLASTMEEFDGPAPDEIDHRIGAPRQALWMLELTVAARHVMDRLAERGLTTAQTEALELCGALGVSAMSEYAATGGRIDQSGRFNAGVPACHARLHSLSLGSNCSRRTGHAAQDSSSPVSSGRVV